MNPTLAFLNTVKLCNLFQLHILNFKVLYYIIDLNKGLCQGLNRGEILEYCANILHKNPIIYIIIKCFIMSSSDVL